MLGDGGENSVLSRVSLVKAQPWSDRGPQLEEGDSCKMFAGAVWLVLRDFVCGPALVGRLRSKICLTSGNRIRLVCVPYASDTVAMPKLESYIPEEQEGKDTQFKSSKTIPRLWCGGK